jgi:small-conductance mechanosensitive channel
MDGQGEVSPDGGWWWSGSAWVTTGSQGASSPWQRWVDTFTRRDRLALLAWVVGAPCAAAGVVALVAVTLGQNAAGWAAVITVALWAFVGGAAVRPNGRWFELVILAVVVAGIVSMTGLVIGTSSSQGCGGSTTTGSECDTAYGLGVMFFFVFALPLLTGVAAIGRLTRLASRRLSHRWRSQST